MLRVNKFPKEKNERPLQKPVKPPGFTHIYMGRWRHRSEKAGSEATLKRTVLGIPGWLSGLATAFSPGRDPGVPGLSPASLHGASFSLYLS